MAGEELVLDTTYLLPVFGISVKLKGLVSSFLGPWPITLHTSSRSLHSNFRCEEFIELLSVS